jgi:hypothetical protein
VRCARKTYIRGSVLRCAAAATAANRACGMPSVLARYVLEHVCFVEANVSHKCPRRHVFAHRLGDTAGHRYIQMSMRIHTQLMLRVPPLRLSIQRPQRLWLTKAPVKATVLVPTSHLPRLSMSPSPALPLLQLRRSFGYHWSEAWDCSFAPTLSFPLPPFRTLKPKDMTSTRFLGTVVGVSIFHRFAGC